MGSAKVYPLELTDDAALGGFARSFAAPLDSLIHSAGKVSLGPLKTAPIAQFDDQYRLTDAGPRAGGKNLRSFTLRAAEVAALTVAAFGLPATAEVTDVLVRPPG